MKAMKGHEVNNCHKSGEIWEIRRIATLGGNQERAMKNGSLPEAVAAADTEPSVG